MVEKSEWYRIQEKAEFLARVVTPGDLLEFHRVGYKHWAVYVGKPRNFRRYYRISLDDLIDENTEYVVHRANPDDSDFANFVGRSTSIQKGKHGIGNVVVQPLDYVWSNSKVRVNNFKDASIDGVADIEEIFDRAFAAFESHRMGSASDDDYNLFSNNCEHFATHCRYGTKCSSQVREGVAAGAAAVVAVGVVGAALYSWWNSSKEDDEDERQKTRKYYTST